MSLKKIQTFTSTQIKVSKLVSCLFIKFHKQMNIWILKLICLQCNENAVLCQKDYKLALGTGIVTVAVCFRH